MAVLPAEGREDVGMAIRRHVLLPTRAPLALRAAYLLLLPVHGELLERLGPRDLHLPALTRARRTAQDDTLYHHRRENRPLSSVKN